MGGRSELDVSSVCLERALGVRLETVAINGTDTAGSKWDLGDAMQGVTDPHLGRGRTHSLGI